MALQFAVMPACGSIYQTLANSSKLFNENINFALQISYITRKSWTFNNNILSACKYIYKFEKSKVYVNHPHNTRSKAHVNVKIPKNFKTRNFKSLLYLASKYLHILLSDMNRWVSKNYLIENVGSVFIRIPTCLRMLYKLVESCFFLYLLTKYSYLSK